MPIFGPDPNRTLATPDYDQIQLGNPVALVDSLRLIWNTIQAETAERKRQSFAWNDVAPGDVTFSSSAGSASINTFLGYKYLVSNDTLIISFSFNVTLAGATANQLLLSLPAGYLLFDFPVPFFGYVAKLDFPLEVGLVTPTTDRNVLGLSRAATAQWPIGSYQIVGFMHMQIRS